MATTLYECDALVGGSSNAVDSIAYASLSNSDLVIATESNKIYHYRWDSTSTAAASSPDVIKPVDSGANPGRFILQPPDFSGIDHNELVNYDPLQHKTSDTIRAESGTPLVVETLTADPASPVDGRIWLRTDL